MRSILLGLSLLIVPLCAVDARADELTNVDAVIARHIEAMGGQAKLDSVKSVRVSGKMTFGGGLEAPMTIEYSRPLKLRMEISFQGMTVVQAFDGESGWFIQPFTGKTDPEKMSPDQIEQIKDQGEFEGPLVNYKKKGHKAELLGKDEVDGSEVYKIKLTKKSGNVEVYALDAEYFLPIQMSGKRKFQGTELEFKVTFGDYKDVDGLVLPHSIQQEAGPMGGGSMTFDKFDLNADITDERFKMPEAKKEEPAEGKTEKEDETDG